MAEQNNQIKSGYTFVPDQLVTPDNLTDTAREATLRKGAITEQPALVGPVAANDQIIISDTSDTAYDSPKRVSVGEFFSGSFSEIVETLPVNKIESKDQSVTRRFEKSWLVLDEGDKEHAKFSIPEPFEGHGFIPGDVLKLTLWDVDVVPNAVKKEFYVTVTSIESSRVAKFYFYQSDYYRSVFPSNSAWKWLYRYRNGVDEDDDPEDIGDDSVQVYYLEMDVLKMQNVQIQPGLKTSIIESLGIGVEQISVTGITETNGLIANGQTNFASTPVFENGLRLLKGSGAIVRDLTKVGGSPVTSGILPISYGSNGTYLTKTHNYNPSEKFARLLVTFKDESGFSTGPNYGFSFGVNSSGGSVWRAIDTDEKITLEGFSFPQWPNETLPSSPAKGWLYYSIVLNVAAVSGAKMLFFERVGIDDSAVDWWQKTGWRWYQLNPGNNVLNISGWVDTTPDDKASGSHSVSLHVAGEGISSVTVNPSGDTLGFQWSECVGPAAGSAYTYARSMVYVVGA